MANYNGSFFVQPPSITPGPYPTVSSSPLLPTGHNGGGTVNVSTATNVTPCSTPSTTLTAGVGPSAGGNPGTSHLIRCILHQILYFSK